MSRKEGAQNASCYDVTYNLHASKNADPHHLSHAWTTDTPTAIPAVENITGNVEYDAVGTKNKTAKKILEHFLIHAFLIEQAQ